MWSIEFSLNYIHNAMLIGGKENLKKLDWHRIPKWKHGDIFGGNSIAFLYVKS